MATTPQPRNAPADHPLADQQDPGRTARIRARFERAFNGRWERVQGALGEVIHRNDALGLRESSEPTSRRGFSRPGFSRRRRHHPRRQRRPTDFRATTLAERIDALAEWFGYLVSYWIRAEESEDARRRGEHYTAEFARQAYIRGIRAAGIELRRSGYDEPIIDASEVLGDGRHEERLQRVYSQTYHDVQTVANATETDVVRTASELLQGDVTPETVDTRLTRRVRKVGRTRTALVAAVRAIDALNTAAIERYARGGVRSVRLIGGKSDRSEERGVYALDRVRRGDAPRPPLHPRDTRFLIPVS